MILPGTALLAKYTPVGDLDWTALANCRELGPAPFFDHEVQRPPRGSVTLATARTFCHECDVQAECLAWALNNLDGTHDYGVWGGTTREERIAMRRRRRSSTPTRLTPQQPDRDQVSDVAERRVELGEENDRHIETPRGPA